MRATIAFRREPGARPLILDLSALPADPRLTADVCIVGAGAAGIALALELAGTPLRILVLESGGRRAGGPVGGSEVDVEGPARGTFALSRARALGGTTTLWAGQLLPLDPIDFEARPWVPLSGWPFPATMLDPYLRRAEALFGVAHRTYDARDWPARSPRPPIVGGDLLFRYSQFTDTPDLGRRYEARLAGAANVTVALHAEVVGLVAGAGGREVVGVELRTPSGRDLSASARHVVLCCGGIDTARLLLAADGLEIAPDVVGRHFQEHAHVKVPVHAEPGGGFAAMFNSRKAQGRRVHPKLVASADWQRATEALNVGADACYDADPTSAVESAKTVLRAVRDRRLSPTLGPPVLRAASRPGELAGALYRSAVKTYKVSEFGQPYLSIQCESAPDPDNRVQLTGAGGQAAPRASLRWRIGRRELDTIERFAHVLAAHLERHRIGRVDLSRFPLPADGPELDEVVDVGFHHLGATRMHDDPRFGVVDSDCRVHGVSNLWIGSGSTFPTGGYSNPTLTIVALCMRLADRLKAELG